MDEGTLIHLDVEFKRYLQILRPYLGQLIDQEVIEICNAWIQRLSNCKDEEKALRNKYVFSLCYQLAKGILDQPFLKEPPENKLDLLYESVNSEDSSSEVEYLVVNFEEPNTKVLYEGKKHVASETEYLSQDYTVNEKLSDCQSKGETDIVQNDRSRKQTVLCYTCPEILRNYTGLEVNDGDYEYRANNLIKKLREIKAQNKLLHNELLMLKEESKAKCDDSMDEIIKVNTATSTCIHSSASSTTLKSLKDKIQELNDSRNSLIDTISNLQDKLENFTEMKKHEMEDIEAKKRLEIIKLRASLREEVTAIFEKKLEEQKKYYEQIITDIQNNTGNEIKHLTAPKDEIIAEKEKLIKLKDAEIYRLQTQLEEQKNHLHSVFSKFLDKPVTDEMCGDNFKLKTIQLEKRLSKLEKSKIKCTRAYEAKLANLQREKHLADCSIQLQLVRQRAQVVNEVAEDNHSELTAALDRLENKYKDIVAKMQATAIQRRMQDQMALDRIIQATCGIENSYNISQGTTGQFTKARPQNQGYDSEVSSIMRGNKVGNVIVGNKSFGEESVIAGYCLNGERMGELFERVYVPQRDGENQK